jgi:predicted ATP-binding protein involved in virulence
MEKICFLSDMDISNYKIIKNLKINFDKELTIIIGDNGVGKTSILNAIRKTYYVDSS